MITKAKSTKRRLWKYLVLILPFTFTMYAFSFSDNKLTKAIGNSEVKSAVEEYLTLSMVAPALTSDEITTSDTIDLKNFTGRDYWLYNCTSFWREGVDKGAEPLPTRKEYLNSVISLIRTPEEIKKHNITCQLIIEYDINPDSTLSNFKFLSGRICGDSETTKRIGYGATDEAIRVMKEIAKTARWKPGTSKDKPVVTKGRQQFFFGDKEVWNMYNAQATYACGAYNAEVYMTNPCIRNFYKEPSWFLNDHFTQIMVSMGIKSEVYQDKAGGKVEISFGITPDGKPDRPEVVKSNNKAFADLALKGVNILEGLKVTGFNHKGKRYNIEIGYEWTEQTTMHSYQVMTIPAEKK